MRNNKSISTKMSAKQLRAFLNMLDEEQPIHLVSLDEKDVLPSPDVRLITKVLNEKDLPFNEGDSLVYLQTVSTVEAVEVVTNGDRDWLCLHVTEVA